VDAFGDEVNGDFTESARLSMEALILQHAPIEKNESPYSGMFAALKDAYYPKSLLDIVAGFNYGL
jgi:hypothetical protein